MNKAQRKQARKDLVIELEGNGMSHDDAVAHARAMYPKPTKLVTDRMKADDTALDDALKAFDKQHSGQPVEQSDYATLTGDDATIETKVKQVCNTCLTRDPRLDMSIAMSVLITVLGNIQDNGDLCDYVIEAVKTLKGGGQAGDYKIQNDGKS